MSEFSVNNVVFVVGALTALATTVAAWLALPKLYEEQIVYRRMSRLNKLWESMKDHLVLDDLSKIGNTGDNWALYRELVIAGKREEIITLFLGVRGGVDIQQAVAMLYLKGEHSIHAIRSAAQYLAIAESGKLVATGKRDRKFVKIYTISVAIMLGLIVTLVALLHVASGGTTRSALGMLMSLGLFLFAVGVLGTMYRRVIQAETVLKTLYSEKVVITSYVKATGPSEQQPAPVESRMGKSLHGWSKNNREPSNSDA